MQEIKPRIKLGKLTDAEAKNFISENPGKVILALGKYRPKSCITNILEAEKYVNLFLNLKIFSPALQVNVCINHITKDHLFKRKHTDIIRRANILGDAIEVLENSSEIHAVDTSEKEIVYYETLGLSKGGKIMNIKVSERNGEGKVLWTIIDIK